MTQFMTYGLYLEKKLSTFKGELMDFIEKAKIRLEHWITHNDHHKEEYELFAEQLEQAGRQESARQVREMIRLSTESNECLRKALAALEK